VCGFPRVAPLEAEAAGERVAGQVSPTKLRRGFGLVVIVVGVAVTIFSFPLGDFRVRPKGRELGADVAHLARQGGMGG
jgi:hypothetical protein